MYTCHHVKSDLLPYVRRELSPARRRLVAQHLDTCAACYAEYRRVQAFDGDLGGALPRIGMPNTLQLAHVWAGVQTQIANGYAPRPQFRLRYGAVLILLVMSLLLPYSLHQRHGMAVPLPPTPQITEIALATGEPTHSRAQTLYTQTTPGFSPNDAPSVSATETP
jgi:anti-sigma factor RsiW